MEEAEVAPESQHEYKSPFVCASTKRNPEDDSILPERACGKYVHLDVTRVSCIIVIVLCAGEHSWLEYNTLFFQNWVVQYLWLVCGVCYGLSARPLLQYVARLLLLFFLGIAAMRVGCQIKKVKGLPIGGNLWFFLVLAVFSVVLAPLKSHINKIQENPHALLASSWNTDSHAGNAQGQGDSVGLNSRDRLLHGIVWISGGLAALLFTSALVMLPLGLLAAQANAMPGNHDEDAVLHFLMHTCSEIQACLSAVWILWSFPHVFSDTGVIAWLLVINMYAFKVVCGYGETAFFSSGFQLMLIGLTASRLGLSGRQLLSTLMMRYWMVVVFTGAWCFLPGTHGMLMLVEPTDFFERQRFILLEALLVVGWLVAGADMVDPKIFEVDQLLWLSDWASLLFLSQQAVLIIVPDGSWIAFTALMPFLWVFRKIAGWSSGSESGSVQ